MNTLGQWIWMLVWFFLFFVYLVILFQIVADLIRDHALSGWWKAVWIIGLVVMPYLVALIYLIARGRTMAERQRGAFVEAKSAQDSYIRSVASGKSPADQIADAKALLDSGAIDAGEFATLKAKALA
ncbi:SHOCT domain-containing protein [Cellulomonas terrae]|uniref:Membrane protein n=1 Tax=Cellulomonas terrae TaxID=311234 RepID=A0A511JH42_9CELL|nr:SHOCT domain-containing protein [Cellulomonas terrae]GEL97266.1 membrane protein [Cellulomonas terrae]